MRIAFHAPLKAPDHPVPSGDRAMARSLLAALRAGGHAVEVASTFRSYLPHPDPGRMAALEAAAETEAARIAAIWRAEGPPDLWFCYHPYYKAPDLVGRHLARWFALPSATAEASHADKRARGPWASWHAHTEATIRAAAVHVCLTPRDAEGLARLVDRERITLLPPFIAAPPAAPRSPRTGDRVELVTVAMMRPGDKARSFAFLAAALAALPPGIDWRITVVGDGPERDAVRALFAPLSPGRVAWTGECEAPEVAAALAAADLHVWPGFGEAYGIAYLEAASAGLPSLAMKAGGIPSVVEDGRTGVLTPEGDLPAYVAALTDLIGDAARRARLGAEARRLALGERTVERAAAILSASLASLPCRAPASRNALAARDRSGAAPA